MTAIGESGHFATEFVAGTFSPLSWRAICQQAVHPLATLTEIYIEALLVGEDAADQVWAAWNANQLSDEDVYLGWLLVAYRLANSATRNS